MKKYLTLLCMLIIGTLNIGGCGREEADFETSVFKISDDITKVNVEHYVRYSSAMGGRRSWD